MATDGLDAPRRGGSNREDRRDGGCRGDAVDRAIDEATGVPTDDGEIESFTHDGASVIAERRGCLGIRTLVLIHGIGMGRKVFADLSLRAEEDALVVAIDLPGYGEAPEPPRTPTIDAPPTSSPRTCGTSDGAP
jgi:pimeloyl-ACP methyl ester carboxylesterase